MKNTEYSKRCAKRYVKMLVLISALFTCVFSVGSAFAWTAPTASAPNANSDAPLNVSLSSQIKNGILGTGSLGVTGSSSFSDKVQILGGNPGSGKVLVTDDQGNATWMDYAQARKNADRLRCPNGSSKTSLNGKTFCGYWKTTSGYCDAFGKSYDAMVACYDTGTGRNHGISPFANGCYSWEGSHNNGGPGLKFYCEKSKYTPKTSADCTDPKAVIGSLIEPSLSSGPITTCNVQTPYTYKGCLADETSFFGYCYGGAAGKASGIFGRLAPRPQSDIPAIKTTCLPGWTSYLNDCI